MKVSIIVPHFNSWDKLYELLKTIPTTDNYEVIVIDDHSFDYDEQKGELSSQFPKVTLLKNLKENKGAGSARNMGLDYATGEWILFADSDDLFTPILDETVNKYYNSKYDVIYFIPTSFNESGNSSRHIQYEKYVNDYMKRKDESSLLALKYKFIVPWSKMIRSKIIKKNNIRFEKIMYSNDILFSAKIGYYSKNIFATSQQIYMVRENEGSLTTIKNESVFEQRFSAFVQYAAFLKEKLSKKEFKLLHISMASQFINARKFKVTFNYYIYMIKIAKQNKIPICDKRLYNIRFLLDKILSRR